jgi:hypothetical protein
MRRRRRALGAFLWLVPLLVCAEATYAQVEIGGFGQVNYAARVTGAPCPSPTACDFLLGEERVQLKLEAFSESGSAAFASRVDFYHDAVVNEPGIEVREIYIDLTSEHAGLRAGRQIVTWGTGDLLFINDTFPKDWIAFFTGRPLEYLKVGSDALKIDLYPGFLDAEIVFAPFFQPDRYPTGGRLILFDPLSPALPRRLEQKERSWENTELSAKLSRYVSDWEVAAYASRGFFRTPAASLAEEGPRPELRLSFPRLNTYGASARGGLRAGVLSIEGGYYDSVEDREGDDPAVENSQVKGLIGYSHALWRDATLGAQAFVEWMPSHDAYRDSLPPGFPAREAVRWTVTTRFTQLLSYQTITLNLFAFWGLTEHDALLIPSIRYSFSDALWAELGSNIFLARNPWTTFGALDRNDNVYLTLRYGF